MRITGFHRIYGTRPGFEKIRSHPVNDANPVNLVSPKPYADHYYGVAGEDAGSARRTGTSSSCSAGERLGAGEAATTVSAAGVVAAVSAGELAGTTGAGVGLKKA